MDLNPYFVSSGKNFKVKFYASDVTVPFGVEILDISPKEASIELDRVVMMEMPIKVQYIGDAPRDRKIKEASVEPQNIMISGPVEILKSVSRLETAPVNLALFNKDEGVIGLSLSDLDPRLKYEESVKIKLKYKTQLLNSKHPSQK
jgi:YbbR domain-containing protein